MRTEGGAPQGGAVLVVGSGPAADPVRRALASQGSAMLACSGPPGCALARGVRCRLVEAADVLIVLPAVLACRETVAGLTRCVSWAEHAIVVEPSVIRQPPLGVDIVRPDGVAAAIERAMRKGLDAGRDR